MEFFIVEREMFGNACGSMMSIMVKYIEISLFIINSSNMASKEPPIKSVAIKSIKSPNKRTRK